MKKLILAVLLFIGFTVPVSANWSLNVTSASFFGGTDLKMTSERSIKVLSSDGLDLKGKPFEVQISVCRVGDRLGSINLPDSVEVPRLAELEPLPANATRAQKAQHTRARANRNKPAYEISFFRNSGWLTIATVERESSWTRLGEVQNWQEKNVIAFRELLRGGGHVLLKLATYGWGKNKKVAILELDVSGLDKLWKVAETQCE